MEFVNSLRVAIQQDSAGKFVVSVDGRKVVAFATKEEATRFAAAEGSRIEGF